MKKIKRVNMDPDFKIGEVELEPGLICEYGQINPSKKMKLEYTPRSDFIDFGFCLSGQIEVDIDGIDTTFTTKKNSGNIIHGGNNKAVHELIPGIDFKWLNIRLSSDYFEHCIGCDRSCIFLNMQEINGRYGEPVYYYYRKITPTMKHCISQIWESDGMNPAKRLLLRAKCLELVAYQLDDLCSAIKDVREENSLDTKVRNARDILIHNYRNPPSIKEISRTVGLNDTYLKQAFKEKYHTSIYQYLLAFRMEYARFIITQCKLSVSEAGYAVGYSSMSQFSGAFKKYHGSSPGFFKNNG
jgi:AraC-like DNA-binding protein